MTEPHPAFMYSNLPVRPTSGRMRALARAVPGVRETLAMVAPYAQAWEAHNARAAVADGPLWLAFGDSMAQGIGASAYDRGWPGQLADRLDPAYRLVNLSAHGARIRDVLDHQLPAAAPLGIPDLVTVMIGANDIVSRRLRPFAPGAFAELLEALPAGAVVANMPNPRRAADEIDAMLRAVASAGTVVLADFRGPRRTSWRGKLAADHFHPNDRGYADLADVFATAIVRTE